MGTGVDYSQIESTITPGSLRLSEVVKYNKIGYYIYSFLNGKYLMDILYNGYFINGGITIGYTIAKVLDRGFIELLGPNGLSLSFIKISNNISKLDTGIITTYALYMTLSIILIIL